MDTSGVESITVLNVAGLRSPDTGGRISRHTGGASHQASACRTFVTAEAHTRVRFLRAIERWGSGFQSKAVEAHTGFEPVPPP